MTNIKQLVDRKREFLILQHRGLNSCKSNFEEEIEKIHQELAYSTNRRVIVPGFEGDYMIPSWSNDVIMVHGNYQPSKRKFEELRRNGHAAYLDEILDRIVKCKKPESIVLCLEAKRGTDSDATSKAVQSLKEADIKRAYFDSFFGWKLRNVKDYPTSKHLLAKIGPIELSLTRETTDIVTIPYPMTFNIEKYKLQPLIYGAIKDRDQVKTVSQNPKVIGVFWRKNKTSAIKMFLNSFGYKKLF